MARLGESVTVFAITRNKEVVFVRQYKHGIREIVLELPAGFTDEDNPLIAAKGELLEETGIITEELILLGEVYPMPTKSSSRNFGFLLENAEITEKQKLDITEDIGVVLVPLGELDERIKKGEIKAASTLAVISLARAKYPEIFKD